MNHTIEEQVTFTEQFREFLRANMTLLVAAAVAFLLISDVFGVHGVLAMRRSQKQAADIQKQIEELNNHNRQLEVRVNALKTDPEAVERIAREEMGLAKPGEYIFKVPPRSGQTPDAADPSDAASPRP